MRGWVSADAGLELGGRLTQVCLERAAGSDGRDVDDEARTGYLRTAARSALPEQFERVRTAIGEDVDLGWRALVRRAAFGEAPEEEVEQLLARDPNPEAWVRAAAVRAARPDAEVKDRVWRTILEAESLSSFAGQVGEAFWQAGQDEVLGPFAERYLELLPALGRHNLVVQLAVPNWFFPVVGVDEEYRRRLVDAAKSDDVSPPVRRSVLERADVLERMLRARALT
jgi:aminopeptidase N